MFMHGGLAHILGNLLFLFIFGDNIEDRLGRARYLLFYLVCGTLASLAHVFSTVWLQGNINVPSLGASGAISGVLGGYIVLFPRKRVRVILIRFLTQMPAFYAIGIWFVFQLLNGIGIFGAGSQVGGVAYAAHIGGFLAGVLLIKAFAIGR
jgi:membrane associated rhomboid family serine protease